MPESVAFNRSAQLQRLESVPQWDLIVVGGGATGLGIALDAASRGLTTLLLEQYDFAKGTSSRSTKLIHGGVRYLAQGNIRLVREALKERDVLTRIAPHLVRKQSFIIPCYSVAEWIWYGAGLKIYDLLAGSFSYPASRMLSAAAVSRYVPGVQTKGLKGGVLYYDGQFDDARLALAIAKKAVSLGATMLNYFPVTGLIKKHGSVKGVTATDQETGKNYQLAASVVINATGVFVDRLMHIDEPDSTDLVRPSQGIHLVVDKKFLRGESALMIPRTSDKRVLFAVPWQRQVLLGTTDTPVKSATAEPEPLETEIDFILQTVTKYMDPAPGRNDVKSVFAGLRPLAAGSGKQLTRELSRGHKLVKSESGLITIIGGKWTTYRLMAEEAVNLILLTAGLQHIPCKTKNIFLTDHHPASPESQFDWYGDEAPAISRLSQEPGAASLIANAYPYTQVEIIWAIRHEMARTVEDVLARRLRLLFLDADAAIAAAPLVADLLIRELTLDPSMVQAGMNDFISLAKQYKLKI